MKENNQFEKVDPKLQGQKSFDKINCPVDIELKLLFVSRLVQIFDRFSLFGKQKVNFVLIIRRAEWVGDDFVGRRNDLRKNGLILEMTI